MFNAIARPFGILLMFLYELVHNYGMALFLIAVVIKVLLLPFQMKGKRGMMRQSRLQPRIAELQKKHAANKQKLNEEMAKLYKEEGVNPASGCLWSFIQMPIMIAIFYAIRQPLTLMMGVKEELLERGQIILNTLQNIGVYITDDVLNGFYAQVHIAQAVSSHWDAFKDLGIEGLRYIQFNLGILDLAQQPQWDFFWNTDWSDSAIWLPGLILFFFPLISGGAQFVSAHIMRKLSPAGSPEAASGTMGTVIKFMPLMSVWFGFILPAALSLYWTIGTVLQIAQDIWLTKKYTKILDEEDAEKAVIRKARDAELEAKREETERKKAEGLAERNTNTSKRKKKKSDKQGQRDKAAEWEKKNAPAPVVEGNDPSRVGNRRYARGRAYDPDRYANVSGSEPAVSGDVIDDVEIIDDETPDTAYEYAETEVDYTDDSYDSFEEDEIIDSFEDDDDDDDLEDDDDDDDFEDDDDDDLEDDDDDDDFEDDDDDGDIDEEDDDDPERPSTERFDTKRFD